VLLYSASVYRFAKRLQDFYKPPMRRARTCRFRGSAGRQNILRREAGAATVRIPSECAARSQSVILSGEHASPDSEFTNILTAIKSAALCETVEREVHDGK
jgi:hypothetical protein